MKNRLHFFIHLLVIHSLFFISCNRLPDTVQSALQLAGDNKQELLKVVEHYQNLNDKQKLAAAYYLIENMPGNGWIEYKPYFTNGNPAPFYLFDYTNNDTIHLRKKQIEDSAGSPIVYNVSRIVEDIKVIKADFIIENIEYAFKAWQEPWASYLTFNQFCEYLLPYRFGTEPLQNWRKQVYESMQWLKDSLNRDEKNILKACTYINDSLKRKIAYRHYELDFYPFGLSYTEVLKLKGGRCDDLNLVGAYWMRAIGIPVINDFTPNWANSNFGGHTWLSLLMANGKNLPFNVAYDNPIVDSLPFKENKLCKVYRREYKKQDASFRSQFPNENEYPGYLFTNNYYDVTNEYCTTKNIQIPIIKNFKKPFAYLGVLCEKDWTIVDVGKIIDNKINFNQVGINTIYVAYYYDKDTLQILSSPFILNDKLEVKYLNPDTSMELSTFINLKKDYWWLRKDRQYQLMYWQGNAWGKIKPSLKWDGKRWNSEETTEDKFTDSTVSYESLPKNALFRFQNIESIVDIGSFGRPFLIKDGKIIYY